VVMINKVAKGFKLYSGLNLLIYFCSQDIILISSVNSKIANVKLNIPCLGADRALTIYKLDRELRYQF